MRQTINNWDFRDAFRQAGREDNFSYDGLNALFEYFEDYEDDIGEEIELDVIAICCEYTEFEDLEEFRDQYGGGYETMEDVYNQTQVIMIPKTERFISPVF